MAMLGKLRRRIYPFYFFSKSFSSCKRNSKSFSPLKPPTPKQIPFTVSAHGTTWNDPYHWMRDIQHPDMMDYLNKENDYAEAFMKDTKKLQQKLADEMKSRMPGKTTTPPESWGDWLYYQYIPEGKEYPVLCRKSKHKRPFVESILDYFEGFTKEQILLDWNEIAEDLGYVHVGTCRISPNHKYLAYTLDKNGSEMFVLQIKNLQTGYVISKPEAEGVVSLAWTSDSACLLYTVCDENLRPYRVFCKDLRTDAADDLLFTVDDMNYCVDITKTKDGKYITINSNSRASSEIYIVDASNIKNGVWLIKKRLPDVQYFLEHHNGFFYILTNSPLDNSGTFSNGYYLARSRAKESLWNNWQEIVLPDQSITFHDMDMFRDHLVLSIQKNGLPLFCSIPMPIYTNFQNATTVEELDPWFFPIPSDHCNITPGSNHDFTSAIYRVVISSPVMPDLIVDYDMDKRKFDIVHQEEVMGLKMYAKDSYRTSVVGLDLSKNPCHEIKYSQSEIEDSHIWPKISEDFICTRKNVISHDNVEVPLTIIYSINAKCNGQSPGILHGYGAYGEDLDKSWSSDLVCLLSRGWTIAYADVRGGGESTWHQGGTGLNKLNSIYDFAACGSHLINEDYVHKDRLCAIGSSAGGLLVGATMNMYPDLFCAAILKVPFLDICNTMLDPSLPLTTLDYEEFGDPRRKTDFENIQTYSPYDNIPSDLCCPPTLVTASFYDSRVGVWEAAKWIARVREISCPKCSQSVILKTNMKGGHFGEGGRFIHCEETAFEYAFLIKIMEMNDSVEL